MPEAASRSSAGVLSHLLPVQLIMPACCWSVMIKRILGLRPAFGLSAADVVRLSISPIAAPAVAVMNSRLLILLSKSQLLLIGFPYKNPSAAADSIVGITAHLLARAIILPEIALCGKGQSAAADGCPHDLPRLKRWDPPRRTCIFRMDLIFCWT